MTRTLLKAAAILTLDREHTVFEPGHVVIEDDVIIEVGGQIGTVEGFDRMIDLGDKLVMPGLVNAHTHTPMILFRGLCEGVSLFTMDGFLNVLRVLEAAADDTMVAGAVEVSCAEMIRTGTTCFADQYFYMHEIVPVVKKSGMRAALAYGIVELGDETSRSRELGHTSDFLESLRNHPLIDAWVGPHAFFVDNSPDAIKMEIALAEKYGTGFHIHLATNFEEEDYCRAHYGISAVEKMKELGILDHPLLAAHCITIPESDFPALAAAPFTAVICPSAAMRSGSMAAPLPAMRAAGINTALGTDNVANANSYDLFNEMQLAAKLMAFNAKKPAAVTAREIVEMATLGGAKALGLDHKIGSLEAGKQADLIALDLDGIGWGPRDAQDLYTALVYSVSGMHVTDVMVAGSWLLTDRQWTTLDYAAARKRLKDDYAELKTRLNKS